MERTTHRQYLTWLAWLEVQAPFIYGLRNNPFAYAGAFTKYGSDIVVEPQKPITREQAAAWSKAKWLAAVGLIGRKQGGDGDRS